MYLTLIPPSSLSYPSILQTHHLSSPKMTYPSLTKTKIPIPSSYLHLQSLLQAQSMNLSPNHKENKSTPRLNDNLRLGDKAEWAREVVDEVVWDLEEELGQVVLRDGRRITWDLDQFDESDFPLSEPESEMEGEGWKRDIKSAEFVDSEPEDTPMDQDIPTDHIPPPLPPHKPRKKTLTKPSTLRTLHQLVISLRDAYENVSLLPAPPATFFRSKSLLYDHLEEINELPRDEFDATDLELIMYLSERPGVSLPREWSPGTSLLSEGRESSFREELSELEREEEEKMQEKKMGQGVRVTKGQLKDVKREKFISTKPISIALLKDILVGDDRTELPYLRQQPLSSPNATSIHLSPLSQCPTLPIDQTPIHSHLALLNILTDIRKILIDLFSAEVLQKVFKGGAGMMANSDGEGDEEMEEEVDDAKLEDVEMRYGYHAFASHGAMNWCKKHAILKAAEVGRILIQFMDSHPDELISTDTTPASSPLPSSSPPDEEMGWYSSPSNMIGTLVERKRKERRKEEALMDVLKDDFELRLWCEKAVDRGRNVRSKQVTVDPFVAEVQPTEIMPRATRNVTSTAAKRETKKQRRISKTTYEVELSSTEEEDDDFRPSQIVRKVQARRSYTSSPLSLQDHSDSDSDSDDDEYGAMIHPDNPFKADYLLPARLPLSLLMPKRREGTVEKIRRKIHEGLNELNGLVWKASELDEAGKKAKRLWKKESVLARVVSVEKISRSPSRRRMTLENEPENTDATAVAPAPVDIDLVPRVKSKFRSKSRSAPRSPPESSSVSPFRKYVSDKAVAHAKIRVGDLNVRSNIKFGGMKGHKRKKPVGNVMENRKRASKDGEESETRKKQKSVKEIGLKSPFAHLTLPSYRLPPRDSFDSDEDDSVPPPLRPPLAISSSPPNSPHARPALLPSHPLPGLPDSLSSLLISPFAENNQSSMIDPALFSSAESPLEEGESAQQQPLSDEAAPRVECEDDDSLFGDAEMNDEDDSEEPEDEASESDDEEPQELDDSQRNDENDMTAFSYLSSPNFPELNFPSQDIYTGAQDDFSLSRPSSPKLHFDFPMSAVRPVSGEIFTSPLKRSQSRNGPQLYAPSPVRPMFGGVAVPSKEDRE